MKRISILVALALLALTAAYAWSHEGHTTDAKAAAAASKTISGEVVDTGCYLGHGAHGAKHVGCATKCINGGMPMGLLTSDGTVYLLTLNHDNPDPYNKLKTMAGKNVSVTGDVMERGGMKAIDVSAVKAMAEAAPAK